MKRHISKKDVLTFILAAESGTEGRETEIGGGNFRVELTILGKDEIAGHPELVGGTVRVYLNKYHKYIGHTVFDK